MDSVDSVESSKLRIIRIKYDFELSGYLDTIVGERVDRMKIKDKQIISPGKSNYLIKVVFDNPVYIPVLKQFPFMLSISISLSKSPRK